MTFSVSSWFVDQAASENPPVKRKFTIAGSDYTDYVLRWPTIKTRWNELQPNNVTIGLANEDQTFNFFKTAKAKTQSECVVEFGFKDKPWDSGSWNFTNTLDGFTAINAGLAVSGSEVTITSSAADSQLYTQSLDLVGADSFLIMARIKRVESVAWEGDVFYATSGHAFVSSYRANASRPAGIDSDYVTAFWDMRSLATGDGSDWLTNTITRLRFDFTNVNTGAFSVDWVGFATSAYTDELITVFTGKVGDLTFSDGAVDLRLIDKVQQLSDRIVGTTNSIAVFSSTTMRPSDIAWTLCTCYGGFSSIQSTSNPDIDYEAFQDWASAFTLDNILTRAMFKGQKVTEALRKLMEHTQSASFMSNNRVKFARWTAQDSGELSLTDDHIKSLSVQVKADDLVNKQWIEFNYDPTSKSWANALYALNQASINSYGTRENVIKDESVWFTNSASALNLAQRFLVINKLPYDKIDFTSGLVPLYKEVGDTLNLSDTHLQLDGSWRIMEMALNTDTGEIAAVIDNSQGVLSALSWVERTNPKNFNLYGIAWNGSVFVAVGAADGTDAYVITSPDGITWTERSNPKNFALNSVAWSASIGLFVAVGAADGTDAYVISSPDGITWTERTNPKNFALNGITATNGTFVAVGGADGTDAYIITSTNGTSWTERSNPKNFALNGVAYATDLALFAAVGAEDGTDAYLVTSPDGTTWTERSNPKNFALRGVVWREGTLIAVGAADGTNAYVATSTDGLTWVERDDGNTKNITLNAVAWSGQILTAAGEPDGGNAYLLSSEGGDDWTERDNPKNYALNAIAWNDTLFCAVGDAAGAMTFTEVAPAVAHLRRVAVNSDGLWVALGSNLTQATNYLSTSDDGIIWTSRTPPNGTSLDGLCWDSYYGKFFAGAWAGMVSKVHASSDGVNWTSYSVMFGGAPTGDFIFYNFASDENGNVVAAVRRASDEPFLIHSADGATWTMIDPGFSYPNIPEGVAYSPSLGLWVIAMTNSIYSATSPTGTWTARKTGLFQMHDVVWSESFGLFVAVGDAVGGDGQIFTSSDGITWTERANPKNFALHGVTASNHQFIAVGAADGTDAYMITSPDGITWTEQANPKNYLLRDVAYHNEMFIAVGISDGTDAYAVGSTDDPDAYIITSF